MGLDISCGSKTSKAQDEEMLSDSHPESGPSSLLGTITAQRLPGARAFSKSRWRDSSCSVKGDRAPGGGTT